MGEVHKRLPALLLLRDEVSVEAAHLFAKCTRVKVHMAQLRARAVQV